MDHRERRQTTQMNSLLQARRQLKKKKPDFIMQDKHKKARLKTAWRKPKGSDSKMRVGFRGYRRSVEIGWGSPKEVKHLHPTGLRPVVVQNAKGLEKLDSKTDGIIIGSSVGTRKRVEIITEAIKKNLRILNIKDPRQFLEETNKRLQAKVEEKKQQTKEKEEKDKEKKAAAQKKETEKKKEEPKDELAEKVEEEEKKKQEKEEKDKILIRKT
ncbi:MAG: 50S ribosomal protein L32e [Candidatus Woesearchaeota archaeon]